MRPARHALLLATVLLTACGGPAPPEPRTADPGSTRALRDGLVVGSAEADGSHAWRGIPFAAPPVGELRWRAPRPPEPWEGTREALAFGSPCAQVASYGGGRDGAGRGEATGSEDCLYLNVWAPRFPAEGVPRGAERLPVMVWIHGGGNSIGDAWPFDGSVLAGRERVVLVTVHYRLGPLGWFRHASLRAGATTAAERSGNFGTLDLVMALDWVRANVGAFGGDPGNVTIFGESAGGWNVYSLLLSPLADGLFHRAIVQSGVVRSHTPAQAENRADAPEPGHAASSGEVLERLLAREGVDRAAAESDPGAFLRGLTSAELLAVYAGTGGDTGMIDVPMVFGDGVVLPAGPAYEALARGDYNRVPVILGTNRDENKLFMSFDPRYVRSVFRLPLWARDEAVYERDAAYRSRMWKASGVDEPAAAMRAVQGASVFAYRFDWDELPTILFTDLGSLVGAAHAVEIPFVFGSFDWGRIGRLVWREESEPGRTWLSEAMRSYWTQFALTGDPDRGREWDLPPWRSWGESPDAETFLVLDSREGGGIRMSRERLSTAGLVAELQGDDRFADDEERCALLGELARWTPQLDGPTVASSESCSTDRAAAAGG